MPRKATSLDEQLLLEACRFGGNDEAVAGMLRQFHFESFVLKQALVTLEASQIEASDSATHKTILRLNRRIASIRPD